MIVWVVLVLCIAVLLSVGIERLLSRLGIRRAEEPGPNGLAQLAGRLERWSSDRRRQ